MTRPCNVSLLLTDTADIGYVSSLRVHTLQSSSYEVGVNPIVYHTLHNSNIFCLVDFENTTRNIMPLRNNLGQPPECERLKKNPSHKERPVRS